MWGSILTEANTLTNFNFGFSTYKSDILLHLSQWQYWWWFWFSFFWTLYFFIIIRLINKRTFTFNPVLNTSIRGHGKWGDFLVALIPLSWCGNILVNSNFILRMIEWQNESSLFTIRVQGKQWYWVYKFDAGAAYTILSAPKNIGHNRWFVLTPQESYCADNYYQILHLGTQLEFKGLYYKYLNDDGLNQRTLNLDKKHTSNEVLTWKQASKPFLPYLSYRTETYNKLYFTKEYTNERFRTYLLDLSTVKQSSLKRFNFGSLNYLLSKTFTSDTLYLPEFTGSSSFYDFEQVDDLSNYAANIAHFSSSRPLKIVRGMLNKHTFDLLGHNSSEGSIHKNNSINTFSKKFNYKLVKSLLATTRSHASKLYSLNFKKLIWNTALLKRKTLEEINDCYLGNKTTSKSRIRFGSVRTRQIIQNISKAKSENNIKIFTYKLSDNSVSKRDKSLNTLLFFNVLFQDNNKLVEKIDDSEMFWGYRQKKYKRFKKYLMSRGNIYDSKTLEPISEAKPRARMLKSTLVQNFSYSNDERNEYYHNAIKYNRHRSEMVPVNLARRLLRTKRTLVLPAHVNITLISNSYDVVHSWFIPGLGLKIDCVPGRSTHHSFYIDNVGFYYGQCAEICGRYHHHMPIRLCALTFEHFLVWWQRKGLRRLHRFSLLTDVKKQKNLFLNGQNGAIIV